MQIDFKKVTLHNFMSFGDATIVFDDAGFIRVSGINQNPLDNAGSNGSGKSSIWEAIIWAITGETIRGTKQIVNIHGTDGCFVDIEFSIDNKRYQIIRSKDHSIRKTNIQILIDDTDVSGKGIRDSEKLLQQYLPDLTASLLGSVIILGQGLPQKFTNNTPAGRKEVLEKLSKSDFMIEDLKARVSTRKAELQNTLRQQEDSILKLNTQETFLQSQIQDAERQLANTSETSLNTLLEDRIREQEQAKIQLDSLKQSLDDVTQSITKISTKLAEFEKDHQTQVFTERDKYDALSAPFFKSLNEHNGELNALKKQLNQIKSIKDVCPTCGQKLPDVHKPNTSGLENDLQTIQLKIKETEDILKSYDETYQLHVQELARIHQENIADLKVEQSELTQQSNSLKLQCIEQERTKLAIDADVASILNKKAQLQATIDNCNKIIRENNENLKNIAEEILYNNKQRDLTQSHLEIVNKFDIALKRDFRGYLLSTVISYIEARAKLYSELIFNTTDVTFCLDGNNIDISYCDKAYENLSGGERQKIDLIIQFSIRDMLMNHLNFSSNILVLDEIFDGLDMAGCNKIIDMINSLPDVKNVFIVTHRHDLSIPTDTELVVVKSPAGISEIKQ